MVRSDIFRLLGTGSVLESLLNLPINPQVSASVFEALGLLLTAWRIYFRLKIHRFWWEDAWAAVLFLTGLILIASYWTEVFKSK